MSFKVTVMIKGSKIDKNECGNVRLERYITINIVILNVFTKFISQNLSILHLLRKPCYDCEPINAFASDLQYLKILSPIVLDPNRYSFFIDIRYVTISNSQQNTTNYGNSNHFKKKIWSVCACNGTNINQ